jgi:shikimate dehydrogenase
MPTDHGNDRYCVFGNPVAHSKSPRIHALFAAQTGQAMRYETMLASIDGFAAAVAEFRADPRASGANVTVPFKEEAFRLATRLSARAQAAGAVNTLSFDGAEIIGDNTDGAGLVRDLKHNLDFELAGRRILLLGAGGAARGVILPLLLEHPSELLIANRTKEKASRLVQEFARLPACAVDLKLASIRFDELAGRPFDLVINATSAGLSGAELPAPTFAPQALAYEMLYGHDTPFMQQARAANVRVEDGLGMLVEQAAEAFFVWRGVRPQTAPALALLR